MTTKEHFNQCRERLWALLHDVDFSDGCKSYEGLIEVIQTFPEYFSSPDKLPEPESTIIKLHCYVLGDHRHYTFKGKTFGMAVLYFDKWLTQVEWEKSRRKNDGR